MRAKFVFEARNTKSKYYAPDFLIEELIEAVKENVPLEEINHIVEPAAGDGALIPYIEELAAEYGAETDFFDRYPDLPDMEPRDFLEYTPDPYSSKNRLIITGPPYGEPGATATLWKKFASKAAEIAGYVAFISPVTWLDVENPVPHLQLIYQKYLGEVTFRGSETYNGAPRKVKTAILVYKSIEEPIKPDYSQIKKDFKIREVYGRFGLDQEEYDYFILSWGYNSGLVNRSGHYSNGNPFSKAIAIKVLNEDKRKDLEKFLLTFKEKYGDRIKSYSITSANILSVPRFKSFLKEALY